MLFCQNLLVSTTILQSMKNKSILTIVLMMLVTVLFLSGCIDSRENIYEGDELIGTWESHGIKADIYPDGTGNLEYKSLSTSFQWDRLSNDTIELHHPLIGTHQIQYELESENSIYLTYDGETYHIEKT